MSRGVVCPTVPPPKVPLRAYERARTCGKEKVLREGTLGHACMSRDVTDLERPCDDPATTLDTPRSNG